MHFGKKRVVVSRLGFLLLLIILHPSLLFADSVNTTERKVTKIADGIYVIRHPDAPTGFPNGNTTVIIGEREVFVVDSCFLPSEARKDIAQIRQWTDKPVRYLLNTHWHYDHTVGNGTYWDAFPSLTIIAQIETRKQIEGYNPGWFERYPKTIMTLRQRLASGKEDDGKPLTEERKTEIAKEIAEREQVQAEYRQVVDRIPNLTFDHELNVDLGNREVQIKHLGRGNTAGDTIVYLPKEKIIIAGDLLDHPVPYLGGGYPFDLVVTLQRMGQIEAQTIVPGHGDVLTGSYSKTYLNLVTDFIQTVSAQVSKEVHRLGNGSRNLEVVREAVKKAIEMNAWRQKFAGDDKDNRDFFDSFSMPGLITAAYAQVWGR